MACSSKIPEPIAIVGSSCRFSGDVASPSEFFDLLCKPHDLSREVPEDRFSAKGFYHRNGQYHGTTNSIKAYWLDENPRYFDAPFFSINPKEAEALDPQQRRLLEVVFDAMEAAGFPADRYVGEEVGVFSGCMTQDYENLSARDELSTSPHFVVGNSRAIMANRLSHFFDFRGPSISIDTACSSSLIALSVAIDSLRAGGCTVACVTGANLMYTPDQFIVESTLGMLSPSGKCHMWDTRADGYARGEGIAAVLVKRLSQAIADGDKIEAVIREVGINADGRTSQLTEPNPAAQAALIRKTYHRAGLDPTNPAHRCQYFEAHGTGTRAGDPREARAINEAFFGNHPDPGQGDAQSSPPSASASASPFSSAPLSPSPSPSLLHTKKMLVGSVKTVIGHTEAASGLAGLLKTVWSLQHGLIPPNLHFENLNPEVKPYYTHLQVPTAITPWPDPSPGAPRRASVNSFGFGGSNSHAIVEAYTPEVHDTFPATRARSACVRATGVLATQPHPSAHSDSQRQASPIIPFRLPVVVSAASPKSLRDVVQSYRAYLENSKIDIRELAWHQHARRSDLLYRVSFSASTTSEALQALDSLLCENASAISVERGVRQTGKTPLRILGIFTGQGAQWPTMSASLWQHNRVYRDTIRKLGHALKACPSPCPWTLEEQLMAGPEGSRLGEAAVSQPLCTALQIALVDFVRSIGIDFHTVVGHSSGEMAAAYAAGRLSAEDAVVISYYRGMVARSAGGSDGQKGGMIASAMSEQEALAFCGSPMFGGRIQVAASNSPTSTTLSGDLDAIDLAIAELRARQVGSTKLRLDTAYHSRHMTKPAVEYVEAMHKYGVAPTSPENNGPIWISSVKDRPRTGAQDLDCQYWADNMAKQVQFREAVEYALTQSGDEFDCAIEIGPHPALQGPFTQTARALGRTIPYACPLNRSEKEGGMAVSDFLGFLWSRFGPEAVDLASYIEQSSMPELLLSRLNDLPTYPFDHSVGYWRVPRISYQYNFREEAPHELLGIRGREDTIYEMKWRNILRSEMLPWLEHHRFQDQALLPASAYCIMALEAARSFLQGWPASLVELRDMEILSGIPLESDGPGVETHFSLSIVPSEKDTSTIDARFALYSRPAHHDGSIKMKMNATGLLHIVLGEPSVGVLPSRQAPLSETWAADPNTFYDMMKAAGLTYTGPFRAITSIQRRYGYCRATLDRVHADETTKLRVSPATLDACFQSAFLSYASPGDGSLWTSFLPTRISKVQFNLAVLDKAAGDPQAVLTADTHLAACTPPTEASTALIAVDIGIYDEAGNPEIQVEGLVVRALANTRPEDDVELYLHTVVDIDPTDEIIHFDDVVTDGDGALLAESCRRIASFCLRNHPNSDEVDMHAIDAIESWTEPCHDVSGESQESIATMIRNSIHTDYLGPILSAGQLDPIRLSRKLPLIEEEATQFALFRSHVGRIVKQIAHRYPWMNILHLPTEHTGLTRSVLASVKDSFQSFIVRRSQGCPSSESPDETILSVEGVRGQEIDLDKGLRGQIALEASFDLVIVTTALLEKDDSAVVLKNIGEAMKSGGFLIIVDPRTSRFDADDGPGRPLTPPLWQDVLDACGFDRQARNSYQFHPAGSILVRQFRGAHVPARMEGNTIIADKLLFVRGPSGRADDKLATSLRAQLSPACGEIKHLSLDGATAGELENGAAIIMLADLDEPLMSAMTEHRISQLRRLLRPTLTVLWVTRDSRSGNLDHAASFGFLRTMAAEVPALKLQVLDLDAGGTRLAATTIASSFIQLVLTDRDTHGNSMWTFEPEIHVEDGHRLIPRVMPWHAGNDRVNALRRIVTKPVNTLRHCVEATPEADASGALRFSLKDTKQSICEPPRGNVMIQVDYSSVLPVKLGEDVSGYVCVGRRWKTDERMVALSGTNSSYITCPSSQAIALHGDAPPSSVVLHQLVRCIAALTSVSMTSYHDRIILVDPDVEFANWVADIVAPRLPSRQKVVILETYCNEAADTSRFTNNNNANGETNRYTILRLHTRAQTRDVKQAFSRGGVVFNFLPENHELSQKIATSVPRGCTVYPGLAMFDLDTRMRKEDYPAIKPVWERAVTLSMASPLTAAHGESPLGVTLNELLSQPAKRQPFDVICWKTDRDTVQSITHTTAEPRLSPDKTYYLFGITRDFGHSLCRLFVARGARHIVLASRSPSTGVHWVSELNAAYDADIRMARADVTDLASVRALKAEMARTMPAPGGVVNGAMVLEDRAFDQMTLETWNRVLRPKTVGSSNLDAVFHERDLDFFIMTSSFAAIGGHMGQSNYAAANMYMNGLAAARRRRGLVGSALNIGVIYGLGFLHREKEHLYAGLEREGYPPISEHNLHHMFLEAIVAGRPTADGITADPRRPYDITTGLRRYRRGLENPLHWHVDPRFGHFALRNSGADDERVAVEARKSLQEELAGLEAKQEVADVILAALKKRLQSLLGLPESSIHPNSSVAELGLDSISAAEIRSWFLKNLGNQFAVLKILSMPSMKKLCLEAAEQYLTIRAKTKDAEASK